ncbi:MAG: Zonular occludens toxin [Methyloprofundus sp.]|nr:Zonular occludens toxin [Methyloprofundus sp.]
MIIFHEGLPGSGKSYEAVVSRIIPELKKGRQVFAYIEGLNYEKFAEITEIHIEKLKGVTIQPDNLSKSALQGKISYQGLLHQVTKEQVPEIYNHVADNSLVIIDELQDFFPVGTKKLSEGITEFVTQHRHRGIDVIVMGQDHRDCHNLWKRRIDQLMHFVKRDALGRPNDYTWITYKANHGKFIKLRAGKGSYDPKYFGLYASHVVGTENKDTYSDDRTNIFKSSVFKVWLPFFALVLVAALYFLYTVFNGDRQMVKTDKPKELISHPASNDLKNSEPPPLINKEQEKIIIQNVQQKYSEENYILNLANQYKPRLAALIENKKRLLAYVEFLDDSFHVHEKLNLKQLAALGWSAVRVPYGIKLYKGENSIVVTEWPIDSIGKVSRYISNSL